jgi:hypothetical protein
MSIHVQPLSLQDLTQQEKDSILAHAIDLHLVGSDDADSVGFDIVEKGSANVLHILRAIDGTERIGIAYILPLAGHTDMVEMTVLIFPEYRGKHYTGPLVSAIENFLKQQSPNPPTLCAAVHDHNPMRKELSEFLLRHGYTYSSQHRLFTKRLT